MAQEEGLAEKYGCLVWKAVAHRLLTEAEAT
jgi:hypothetical protein